MVNPVKTVVVSSPEQRLTVEAESGLLKWLPSMMVFEICEVSPSRMNLLAKVMALPRKLMFSK